MWILGTVCGLDTAKFTIVIVAGFRKCRDLVKEGKVFIKDKAKVAIRVGCSERRVVNFRMLLFKSDKKKLSFRIVESQKVCSHRNLTAVKLMFICCVLCVCACHVHAFCPNE